MDTPRIKIFHQEMKRKSKEILGRIDDKEFLHWQADDWKVKLPPDLTPEEKDIILAIANNDEWDPTMIPMHPSVIAYGKRKFGKTVALNHLFSSEYRRWPRAFCQTLTMANAYWTKRMPYRCLAEGFVPEQITRWIQKYKDETDEYTPEDVRESYTTLFLFDDLIGDSDVHNHPVAKNLFTAGRHSKIDVFATTQHFSGFGPSSRVNTDLGIISHQIDEPTMEQVWRNAMSDLTNKVAYFVMKHLTTDYHSIIKINDKPTMELTEKYFRWRANPNPEPYLFCCGKFWDYLGEDPMPKLILQWKEYMDFIKRRGKDPPEIKYNF